MFNIGPIESLILFGPLIVAVIVVVVTRSNARSEPLATGVQPAGWFADPSGRHEGRYWDGSTWTAHVADGGTVTADPL